MSVRPGSVVLAAVCGLVLTSFGITPAGAKVHIPGGADCTMSNASMTFAPGLRNRSHLEGTQTGRGPSGTRFTADLTDCTASGPAADIIDHATVDGNGKVRGSYCEKLSSLKLATRVIWMTADDSVVGITNVKLAITNLAKPSFDDPWTFSFAGTAKPSSAAFPRDLVAFDLTTTSPNWAISGSCSKLSLDSLAFGTGAFAADPPA
jgi:hypothetical protein